jgi:phenylalanyl-tRNA synthetase alpha chain
MEANILKEKVLKELALVKDSDSLVKLKKKYLGRKGELNLFFQELKSLPPKERKERGESLNALKNFLEKEFEKKEAEIKESLASSKDDWLDITAPGKKVSTASFHPLTQTIRTVCEIFNSMGFATELGPEIESEYYNFDALNIPKEHPAREMWDTFWLYQEGLGKEKNKPPKERFLLRTHTSPVQIRYMEKEQPPLRIIAPGKCFRKEATDPSHDFELYQLEGLMVDKNINVSHLKGIIEVFLRLFFGKDVEVRFRPSYFPFTEPSFEVDFKCLRCLGKGCSLCKESGWLEMMGAGMVHPKVFEAVGYKSKAWQGFAFGLGLDRLTMMKFGIPDIRLLRNSDLRVLRQF